VDSAQQIIAEVGLAAATFPSEKSLSSWVGACPGDEESAGVNCVLQVFQVLFLWLPRLGGLHNRYAVAA
jgi:hypothetical protein